MAWAGSGCLWGSLAVCGAGRPWAAASSKSRPQRWAALKVCGALPGSNATAAVGAVDFAGFFWVSVALGACLVCEDRVSQRVC